MAEPQASTRRTATARRPLTGNQTTAHKNLELKRALIQTTNRFKKITTGSKIPLLQSGKTIEEIRDQAMKLLEGNRLDYEEFAQNTDQDFKEDVDLFLTLLEKETNKNTPTKYNQKLESIPKSPQDHQRNSQFRRHFEPKLKKLLLWMDQDNSEWTIERSAKEVWVTDYPLNHHIRNRIKTADTYLKSQNLQIMGTKADGNCFFTALIKANLFSPKASPMIKKLIADKKITNEKELIQALRERLATITRDPTRQADIRGGDHVNSEEGLQLARSLGISVRLIHIGYDQEYEQCGIEDTHHHKVRPQQQIYMTGSQEPPNQVELDEGCITLVDLEGHFVFATPETQSPTQPSVNKSTIQQHQLGITDKPPISAAKFIHSQSPKEHELTFLRETVGLSDEKIFDQTYQLENKSITELYNFYIDVEEGFQFIDHFNTTIKNLGETLLNEKINSLQKLGNFQKVSGIIDRAIKIEDATLNSSLIRQAISQYKVLEYITGRINSHPNGTPFKWKEQNLLDLRTTEFGKEILTGSSSDELSDDIEEMNCTEIFFYGAIKAGQLDRAVLKRVYQKAQYHGLVGGNKVEKYFERKKAQYQSQITGEATEEEQRHIDKLEELEDCWEDLVELNLIWKITPGMNKGKINIPPNRVLETLQESIPENHYLHDKLEMLDEFFTDMQQEHGTPPVLEWIIEELPCRTKHHYKRGSKVHDLKPGDLVIINRLAHFVLQSKELKSPARVLTLSSDSGHLVMESIDSIMQKSNPREVYAYHFSPNWTIKGDSQ